MAETEIHTHHSVKRWLAVAIGLSVLLRIAAAWYMGNTVEVLPGIFDQISYDALARRVIDGHGFSFGYISWPMTAADAPTAHWSYLYTLYLTAVYTIFGPNPLAARLIQAVIVGVAHPYFAYLLGARIFGQRTGLLAALFTAVYIYFVYYSAALMTEPFYITAILAALYGFVRLRPVANAREWRSGFWIGIALGIAILLRQLFLLLIPFLLLWLWLIRYMDSRRFKTESPDAAPMEESHTSFLQSPHAPWRSSIMIVAIIALMILPFTIYNYARFDRFVLLNTNAGFAFFWSNHPVYETRFQALLPPELGTYPDLIPEELRDLDEPALEQALMKRGLGFIVDDPGRYFLLSLSRIPVYFKFWPSAESGMLSNISRVGSFGLFLPFMLAGIIYSLANPPVRRQTLAYNSLLMVFAGIYSAIHLLSWSLIRYRLPVDAIWLIYAGLVVAALWGRFERGRLRAASKSIATSEPESVLHTPTSSNPSR